MSKTKTLLLCLLVVAFSLYAPAAQDISVPAAAALTTA